MESVRGLRKFIRSKTFTLIILVIIIWAFFTIVSGGAFIKLINIRNILNSMVVTSFLTVGAVFLMICGYIDLSTSMIGSMSGVVVAIFLTNLGLPWVLAVLLALAMSGVIGLFNAFLINGFHFQPFIATMAISSVVQGLTMVTCGVTAIPITEPLMVKIGTARIADAVPYTIIASLAVISIYGFILSKTNFGKNIYMIGGNPRAARLSGLNPSRTSYILFLNNALLGGFGGILLSFRLKAGVVGSVANSQFAGMTGAILGGVSFGGGSGGMGGAFVGMLLLNGFNNGLTVMGVPPYWQTFASGALLLIALSFDYLAMKKTGRTNPF
ncbi:MAG: ABC transporter permease [Oscillospiraceae bacterium]|jgi:ribose/xylose/arabinose/galactoside ABC-type transport system permease subunit|nr:ABC transporter permease [Oscillospiraceae bacterium]